MQLKREQILRLIADNLAFSSKSIALENVMGLFNSNRLAQDFFCELFKLVFGYTDLVSLDKLNDVTNYTAIDLGSAASRTAFQITTQNDSEKIKDSVKKFISNRLYNNYDRLIFFIIGEKKAYTTVVDTENRFSFDLDRDVWDDAYLIQAVDKIADIDKLDAIQLFLEKNLLGFKYPERLCEQDVKDCIRILKRDFGTIEAVENNLKRGNNQFIEKKNELNNITWEFFNEKIRGHLPFNKMIFDFLSDPINVELQTDYFMVSSAIQKFYQENKMSFSSFEVVFKEIFGKCNKYEDNTPGLDLKLKIMLHNMYFNCDIGDKPSL